MTKHDPQTRYWAGTRGFGVSWKPKPRPILTSILAVILAYACIAAIIHSL